MIAKNYNKNAGPGLQTAENSGKILDPQSPVPLYFQLQEIIRNKIESGEYKEGVCIPSEAELQRRYNVSRITVRNAIEGLVFDELLLKKQGVGTLVAPKRRFLDGSSKLKSFTEKSLDQHADAETQVLETVRIGASRRIAEHMGINEEEEIIFVKRLRFIDGIPINLFSSYIRGDIGLDETNDYSGSIYRLLEDVCGIIIEEAEKVIEAITAAPEEAELLQSAPGDPLLLVRNTTFDVQGRVVEYAEGLYRSDRYKYVVRLKR